MTVGSEAVFSPYYRDINQSKSQADTFKDQLKKAPPPPGTPLTPDQQAVVNGNTTTLPAPGEQAPQGWSAANITNADGGLLANYLNGNCTMTVIQDGKPVKVSMFDELAKKLGFYISPQDEAKDIKSGHSLGQQAIETHVDMAWQALQTLVAFKNETMANGQSVSSSVVHDGKFLGLSGHDADRGSNYGDLQDYLKDGRGPSSLQTGGDRVHGDGTTKSEAQIGWQHFVHDIKQFVTILKDAVVGLVHIVQHLAEGVIYGLMGEGDKARAAFKAFGTEAKALVEGLVAPILDPIKLHKAEQTLAQDQREHPDDTALIAADQAAVKGDKVSVALDFLFLFIPDAGELKGAAQAMLKLGESVGRDAGTKAGEDTGKAAAEAGREPACEPRETAQTGTLDAGHDPLPSYEEAAGDRPPAYYAVNELRMDDSGQLVVAGMKFRSDDVLEGLPSGDKDAKGASDPMDDILRGLGHRQDLTVNMMQLPDVFSHLWAKDGSSAAHEAATARNRTDIFAEDPLAYLQDNLVTLAGNRSGARLPEAKPDKVVSGPDNVRPFQAQRQPDGSTSLMVGGVSPDAASGSGRFAHYLPYTGGRGTSIQVPRHPTEAEPQFVFTPHLSGCAFFGRIDKDGAVTFTHDSPESGGDRRLPANAKGTDFDTYKPAAEGRAPSDVMPTAMAFAHYNRGLQEWVIHEQRQTFTSGAFPLQPRVNLIGVASHPIQ